MICPIHGEFEQTPEGHLQGKGCLMWRNAHFYLKLKMQYTNIYVISYQKTILSEEIEAFWVI